MRAKLLKDKKSYLGTKFKKGTVVDVILPQGFAVPLIKGIVPTPLYTDEYDLFLDDEDFENFESQLNKFDT